MTKRKTTTGQTMKHRATRTFIFFKKTLINLDIPEGFLLHMVYPLCYSGHKPGGYISLVHISTLT
jgi:hypothetical protein